MTKGALLAVDGTVSEQDFGALGAYQQAVDGYIEAVHLDGATMYVNEDGRLRGLPANKAATALAHGFPAHPFMYVLTVIVGPAVIVGPPDEEGDDTDLPVEWRRRLGL